MLITNNIIRNQVFSGTMWHAIEDNEEQEQTLTLQLNNNEEKEFITNFQ